jgi:hypothetical protein
MKKFLAFVSCLLMLCGISFAGDPILEQNNSSRAWKIGVGVGGDYPTGNWSIYDATAGAFRLTIGTTGVFTFPWLTASLPLSLNASKGLETLSVANFRTLIGAIGYPGSGVAVSTGSAWGTSLNITAISDSTSTTSSTTAASSTAVKAAYDLANGRVASIASGTIALATGAISSGSCTAAQDGGTATGVATTDVIDWGFNGDPTSTTGYAGSANGMLTIIAYPATDHAYFKVCNNTGSSITPGAVTLNWKVRR